MDSESVGPKRWTDHSDSQHLYAWRVALREPWATFLKSSVALWWSLAGPYTYKIFVAFATFIFPGDPKRDTSYSRLPTENEEATPTTIIRNSPSKRIAFWAMVKYLYQCQPGNKPYFTGWGLLISVFIFFLVWNATGVAVSAFLGPLVAIAKADTSALWWSEQCGVWKYDSDANGEPATYRNNIMNREKEARAGDYAQACYLSSGLLSSMRCQSFYQKKISFSNKTTGCHFPDPDICTKGKYSISFDTGVVDSSAIGINSGSTYKFRRQTTCAPLVQDGFVRKSPDDNDMESYSYYYGMKYNKDRSRPISNHTYNTWGDPFYVGAGGYDIYSYISNLDVSQGFWQPISNLTPPHGARLSIIFVSTLHTYYRRQILDPVFPAQNATYVGNDPDPWFYNADPRARAVACIDRKQICSVDGKTCWEEGAEPEEHSGVRLRGSREFNFLNESMVHSTTYDSLSKRLRNALLAQQLVAQYISGDLADDHWMYEMESLFATSLARIQFDAWAIASGEGHGEKGYKRAFPPLEDNMNLCGLFKFRSSGYVNIALWPMIMVILATPIWMVLSLDVGKLVYRSKCFLAWLKMLSERFRNWVRNSTNRLKKWLGKLMFWRSDPTPLHDDIQAQSPLPMPPEDNNGGQGFSPVPRSGTASGAGMTGTSDSGGLDVTSASRVYAGVEEAAGAANTCVGDASLEGSASSTTAAMGPGIRQPLVTSKSAGKQKQSEQNTGGEEQATDPTSATEQRSDVALNNDPNRTPVTDAEAVAEGGEAEEEAAQEVEGGAGEEIDEYGDSILIGFVLRSIGRKFKCWGRD